MTRKEYKDILNWELYRGRKHSIIERFYIKYIQSTTNCIYMTRKMWNYYDMGGKIGQVIAKIYKRRILRKYGCQISCEARVGKGFYIAHPVGIVIGYCDIGKNFTIFQNCTIGAKHTGEGQLKVGPKIGDNVKLFAHSLVLGDVKVCHDVTIGANSLVIHDIDEPGTFVGSPARKLN